MPIESYQIFAVTGGLMFCLGLGGVFLCAHFLKKIIGINIMGSAVFLLFISLGKRNTDAIADPVPHALVITGIVVAVSASAFALALARRIHEDTGKVDFEEEL